MKLLKLLALTASLFLLPLLLLWRKWQGMYIQYPVRCDGGWRHYAWTENNGVARLYVDGKEMRGTNTTFTVIGDASIAEQMAEREDT